MHLTYFSLHKLHLRFFETNIIAASQQSNLLQFKQYCRPKIKRLKASNSSNTLLDKLAFSTCL